jgi:hypothetical protein
MSRNVLLRKAPKTDNSDCLLLSLYRVFPFIAAPKTASFPIENVHLAGHTLTAAELIETKKHTVVTNSRCERHVACDLLAIQI